MSRKTSLSYAQAGVDIDAADRLIEQIKPVIARTRRPGVLGGIGGFGGLFELPADRFRQPVLVSGTDGVGTKLTLALECGRHDTVGIDLVAMCANDVLVQGAEPLFFLDYYATGKLEVEIAAEVVTGIARGCEIAGMALIGGETAELPGMYEAGVYDLAGFCVGAVEKTEIIDSERVAAGDRLIGLASSGAHSNGFSLIRSILERGDPGATARVDGRALRDLLLEPTRIYVKPVLELIRSVQINGIAHITGGGLLDNLPRTLPSGLQATLDRSGWPTLPLFDWLQNAGDVEPDEMLRTFNCGIGMVLVVAPGVADECLDRLAALGEQAWPIGHVVEGQSGVVIAA